MSVVPGGWVETTIGRIATVETGSTPTKSNKAFYGSEVSFYKPGDLDQGGEVSRSQDMVSKAGAEAGRPLPPKTLLVTCIGNLGKSALTSDVSICNQQINAVLPTSAAVPEYLYYWSRTIREWLQENSSATTISIVNKGRFLEAPIKLAPIAEQGRIVAKIDSLSSKSKRAREQLDHIPRLVEKYKQAVLDRAFSPPMQRSPLIELVDPERGIPYGIVQTGTAFSDGVPTVRCGDIKNFSVTRPNLKVVSPAIEAMYRRTRLIGGEVLIAVRGSVGETCVATNELVGCNISREVAMIPVKNGVDSKFIMYFLATSGAKQFIAGNVKGVAQQGINLRDLRNLPAPACSMSQQTIVVAHIERALQWIDRLAADATSARKLIDRLDQAVLAKAFRGELVPQNPNDEPANVLLERIRAERETAPAAKPRRGRAKRS